MILDPARAEALYKAIKALNEGGGQLLNASFDAFVHGEVIIDVCTHPDDRIELRSAGNVTEVHYDLSAFAAAYRLQAL
ncbi:MULTISPECIES: hypothetical protein [Brucella]|jgi:hypothetical protein|uniref:hypothetical protein n=1 Tax=Brucella TaxID=234 RepID=UPI00235EE77C|nr:MULTISPECIES: hypothetical protein [Brucella]WLF99746.1 hypothetical protein Q5698_22520 [Brucella intermedia]